MWHFPRALVRIPLALFFTIAFFILPHSAHAATTFIKPPNNLGLVGYWSFDDATGTKATDFSGNGNVGTLTDLGGGTPIWTNGRFGSALNFNGSNVVKMSDINAMDGLTRVTVSAWVRATSPGANAVTTTIVDKSGCTGGSGDGPFELWIDTGGKAVFGGYYGASVNSSGDSTTNIDDGKWHLLTGTYDGTNFSIWVDGVQQNSTNVGSVTLTSTAHVFSVGGYCDGNSVEYHGTIDDARVYNRALSTDEVAKLYQSGTVKLNTSSVDLQKGTTLARGLVGHWTFDGSDMTWASDTVGTSTDRSGNGNDGTLVNMNRKTSVDAGKLGQALSLDGSTNDVDVGNSSPLQITGSMTISAWVYLRSTPTTADSVILGKVGGFGDGGYKLAYTIDNGPIQMQFHISPDGTADITRYGTTTLSLNQWYHFVGVYDASGQTMHLYLNGTLDDGNLIGSVPASQFNSSVDVLIGAALYHNPGADGFFDGKIDDVRVYNRALSAAEVKQLYNLGSVTIQPH